MPYNSATHTAKCKLLSVIGVIINLSKIPMGTNGGSIHWEEKSLRQLENRTPSVCDPMVRRGIAGTSGRGNSAGGVLFSSCLKDFSSQ